MSNFNDPVPLELESTPSQEIDEQKKPIEGNEPENKDPIVAEVGASVEANTPQETPEKIGEEKPPEAPASIKIGEREISIEQIQNTYQKAEEVVNRAAEVEKLQKAWEETLRIIPEHPFELLKEIFSRQYGPEQADAMVDNIASNYVLERFNWTSKPESERKAITLERQLAQEKARREELEAKARLEQEDYEATRVREDILRDLNPIYKESNLADYEIPGVMIPLEIVAESILNVYQQTGNKPPIKEIVSEVKKSLDEFKARLVGTIKVEDLQGRQDITQKLREADLAKVKADRKAKTAPKAEPEVKPSTPRGGRRSIPVGAFGRFED